MAHVHRVFCRTMAADISAAAPFSSVAHARLTVYVVRHGQTDWNREGRIQGGTDNPLNAAGREQVAAKARTLAYVKIDAVCSSSHQRARQGNQPRP